MKSTIDRLRVIRADLVILYATETCRETRQSVDECLTHINNALEGELALATLKRAAGKQT